MATAATAGGGDQSDDAAAVELQLEQHVAEQRSSLAAVADALVADPSNPDLLEVHDELLCAIKESEEALLHLKRSRLIKQVNAINPVPESTGVNLNTDAESLDPDEIEVEPLASHGFSVGSKCRFRHTDGRWYNGQVIELESTGEVRIAFLNPTAQSMLICKFYQQQRCRFGSNCRMSHGIVVPVASLKQYNPAIWSQSWVGSSVLAIHPSGIWKKAEFDSWDDSLEIGQVVFRDDGSSVKLGKEDISISEYAELSDDDEDTSSSGLIESSGEEDAADEADHEGIGFLEAAKVQSGTQTETAVFAKWEHHTRGIASKIMASMGYRDGMGLGASGQGMVDPIVVKVLPAKQSLDHALALDQAEGSNGRSKKRTRGGKRKRDRKYAEMARAAKAEEDKQPDVFSFINSQLAGQDKATGSGSKTRRCSSGSNGVIKEGSRSSLLIYEDEVKEHRSHVEKLEEMMLRNRKDKVVYEAASRKLHQAKKALAEAEATHASASSAVSSKEKEKKWLKF